MKYMIVTVKIKNFFMEEKIKIFIPRIIVDKDELENIVWGHIKKEFYGSLPYILNYDIEVKYAQ